MEVLRTFSKKKIILFSVFAFVLGLSYLARDKHAKYQKTSSIVGVSKKIHAYIKNLKAKKLPFHGCVLVAKDGHVIYKNSFGKADFRTGRKNTLQTKFMIASVSKQFTAAAIMQLQEKGLLSVNNKLAQYFPNVPGAQTISIHHMLTHTSGLPEYMNFVKTRIDRKSTQEIHTALQRQALNFKPGTKFEYSNTNYLLLGNIIEQLTGRSYKQYIQENVFKPLNMDNSGCNARGVHRAHGCKISSDGTYASFDVGQMDGFFNLGTGIGDGNIVSTVEDLYKWSKGLDQNIILSEKSQCSMYTPMLENYGYGLEITDTAYGPLIEHTGSLEGFSSIITRFPQKALSVIILSNVEHFPIEQMSLSLSKITLKSIKNG